jgi:hypothetical protein
LPKFFYHTKISLERDGFTTQSEKKEIGIRIGKKYGELNIIIQSTISQINQNGKIRKTGAL